MYALMGVFGNECLLEKISLETAFVLFTYSIVFDTFEFFEHFLVCCILKMDEKSIYVETCALYVSETFC